MRYFLTERERKATGSTCFLEFQKGLYREEKWLEDSICIKDEIWDEYQASFLIREVVPEFEPYGITVITKEQWDRITEKSTEEYCPCRGIIEEAGKWAAECFETHAAFSILGI